MAPGAAEGSPGGLRLRGPRVELGTLAAGDVEAMARWYPRAAAAAWGGAGSDGPPALGELIRRVGERSGGGLLAVRREGEPIGLVAYRVGEPAAGWLSVGILAIEEGWRGYGYGSEAVRLLEEGVLARGLADRFRAEVPLGNGLGFYFWLRLGYRPDPAAGEARCFPMVRLAGERP